MSTFREYLQQQLDTDPEFREWWEMREQMKRELLLADLYEGIFNLQNRIQAELIPVAAHDLLNYPHTPPGGSDPRKVKALAACYELQEYLAGVLANETGGTNDG